MSRRMGRFGMMLAAAFAAAAGQSVHVASPDVAPADHAREAVAARTRGSNERQAPAQTTTRVETPSVRFLRSLGAPVGHSGAGCPWPGRRLARSRRAAGARFA